MRKVYGLQTVEEVPPPGNRRGGTRDFAPSAGSGLHYEEQLYKAVAPLAPTKHGQWLKFRDRQARPGYAQPDLLTLVEASRVIIWEAKLTQKAEGEVKLKKLYIPLIRELYKVPVFAVLVFKNILWKHHYTLSSLEEALSLPSRDKEKVFHLHWVG